MNAGRRLVRWSWEQVRNTAEWTGLAAAVSSPVPPAIAWLRQAASLTAVAALYAAAYLAVLAFLTATAFWSYSTFYYLYIPQVSHGNAVHFVYPHPPHPPHPAATTALLPPHASATRLLRPAQPYDVSLLLRVPESPHNLALGTFMVNCSLHAAAPGARDSSDGTLGPRLVHAARPALLHYRSTLVRVVYRILYLVPLTLRLFDEAQELTVPLIDGYVDGWPAGPVVDAVVTLDSPLQVYDAKLFITARFSGLRYLMYHWFYTSYAVGVGFLVVYQFFFLLVLKVILFACLRSSHDAPARTNSANRRHALHRRPPSPSPPPSLPHTPPLLPDNLLSDDAIHDLFAFSNAAAPDGHSLVGAASSSSSSEDEQLIHDGTSRVVRATAVPPPLPLRKRH